jgi:hypothetical protein
VFVVPTVPGIQFHPLSKEKYLQFGARFVSWWTTLAGRKCFRGGHPDTKKNYQELIIARSPAWNDEI